MTTNTSGSTNAFYITTPIFYPNAQLHMGHAYTVTVCDILARFHRLRGQPTYFLTGADENTGKVVEAAEKEGKTVPVFLDAVVSNFQMLFNDLEICHDQFIRTSDTEQHWPGATAMWRTLVDNGDLYKDTYNGLYCVDCESFLTEKDLDEDGNCPDHGKQPEEVSEENYFFRLSRYSEHIADSIRGGDLSILPKERENEVLSLIDQGLEDVSFSRPKEKVSVGIPVPDDPDHVIYVWCDALTNYISALGYGRDDQELFKQFWPADVHVIGKDILKFHALYWPAMLMSAGLELPSSILVHGMITSGGYKMSKSRGNVIGPYELIDQYGTEALRYYLAREISPFEDGDLTFDRFHEVYTSDLVNGVGNLAQRILKLASMNDVAIPYENAADEVLPEAYTRAMGEYRVRDATNVVCSRVSEIDDRISRTEPYKVVKTDPERAKQEIAELGTELYRVSRLLEPIMPTTAAEIQRCVKEGCTPEVPLFPRR